jgi:hypothetical protein
MIPFFLVGSWDPKKVEWNGYNWYQLTYFITNKHISNTLFVFH